MSGVNIVRNLQVLYFSKKNKKNKNLKNGEKFVARTHTTKVLFVSWLATYQWIKIIEKFNSIGAGAHKVGKSSLFLAQLWP